MRTGYPLVGASAVSEIDYHLWLLRAKDARSHELEPLERDVRADLLRLSPGQRADVLTRIAARRAEVEALRQGAALALDAEPHPSTQQAAVPGGLPFSAHPPAGNSLQPPPTDTPPAARPSRLTDIFDAIQDGPEMLGVREDMENEMSEQEKHQGGGGNEGYGFIDQDTMKVAVKKHKQSVADADALAVDAQLPVPKGLATVEDIENAVKLAKAWGKGYEEVKGALLKKDRDYVLIQGRPHIKKSGADKLAAAFGVNLAVLAEEYEPGKRAYFSIVARWNGRERTASGTVTWDELKVEKTEHNLRTKAQTRAEKRAILAVLGSADPAADEE
jgi:hypothetical protein